MIVGTAGHVDHGKTTLVRALTGTDTDRLKEEKARGISIDLGFAYAALVPGRITGFVDVPGHERFVHTMAAGAAGIDFALLVVAADDGVMPQTREHLAILDLFGVRRGIVALTKSDRADADRRCAVTAGIRAALAATGFEPMDILPVSAVTGEGLDALAAELARAERSTPAPRSDGAFRLAIDRCFTLAGAGTIVTGTVLSGTVACGDRVTISPSGLQGRVRSIHAQNRPAECGVTGQRCALNLAGDGITREAIGRGDMVVDPVLHAPTARIDAELRLLAGEARPVSTWHAARLHHASAEVGGRLVPLAGSVEPGTSGFVQLVLDRPVAAAAGDLFVLRDASAQRTIGGGRFLDLRAPARKRGTAERLAALSALREPHADRAVARLLDLPPFLVDLTAFARDHALLPGPSRQLGATAGAVAIEAAGGLFALSPARWETFSEALSAEVARHHADNPSDQGIGREQLRLRIEPRLPAAVFARALQSRIEAGAVVLDGAFVRLPGHAPVIDSEAETIWSAVAPLLDGAARFRPPRVRDLARLTGHAEEVVRRILRLCARLGRVDEIATDHFFTRATTQDLVALACELAAGSPGGFTAAQFRDRLDNGRKVAIQILDFLDRHAITMRRGDLRRINPHRLDLFGPAAARDGRETSPVGRPDFRAPRTMAISS